MFKEFIVDLINEFESEDAILIKICFNCLSSNVNSLKLSGLRLLHKFSPSILEQHEARITSALMLAFSSSSSPAVIVEGLTVSAQFPQAKRISNLLVKSLKELSDKKTEIVIGEFVNQTKKSRRKIELAVLQSWAMLQVSNNVPEKYLEMLVPMWIISIRDMVINPVLIDAICSVKTKDVYKRQCVFSAKVLCCNFVVTAVLSFW